MSVKNNSKIQSFYGDFIKEAWVSQWLPVVRDGVFLSAFFIFLKATNVEIGFANSIPVFMALLAPVFSYYIGQFPDQKKITVHTALVQRILWMVICLAPVIAYFLGNRAGMTFFLILFAVYSALMVIIGLSWPAWMAEIIPEKERGFYFSRRNRYASLIVLAGGFIFAQFMDTWKKDYPYTAFSFLFLFSGCLAVLGMSYLKKLPPPDASRGKKTGPLFVEVLGSIKNSLKDKNFMNLVCFNAVWSFGMLYSGAFGNVYLIRELKLNYTEMVLYNAIATVCGMTTMTFWGRLLDRYGNKPVLIVCELILSTTPLMWAVLSIRNYYYVLPLIWFVAGICWAGLSLAQFNIILKLAPKKQRLAYLSFNTFVVTIATCFAPVLGGYTLDLIGKKEYIVFIFTLGAFQILFVAGAIMRFLPVVFLFKLKEPRVGKVSEVAKIVGTKIHQGFFEGFIELVEMFKMKIK